MEVNRMRGWIELFFLPPHTPLVIQLYCHNLCVCCMRLLWMENAFEIEIWIGNRSMFKKDIIHMNGGASWDHAGDIIMTWVICDSVESSHSMIYYENPNVIRYASSHMPLFREMAQLRQPSAFPGILFTNIHRPQSFQWNCQTSNQTKFVIKSDVPPQGRKVREIPFRFCFG